MIIKIRNESLKKNGKKLLLNEIFFTKRKKLLNKKFKRKNAKSKYKKICLKIFLLIFLFS